MFISTLKKKSKKTVCISLFLFSFFSVNAQNISTDSNVALNMPGDLSPASTVLKTNPYTPFWGPIPFTAEYRLLIESMTAPNQSLQIGFSYLDKSWLLMMMEDSLFQTGQPKLYFKGYRLQGSYRFYISPKTNGVKGFYAGPLVSLAVADISYRQRRIPTNYIRVRHFNANMIAGYQWIINDLFAVDVFCGLGYKSNRWFEHSSPFNYKILNTDEFGIIYNSPLKIVCGFNVGVVF